MRTQLLSALICCLLIACSGQEKNVPPVFIGKAASELPVRIRSYSYPAYRQGVPYKATALYRYDAQNRLIRIDSASYGQSITYLYAENRLSERVTYQNGVPSSRTQFLYNGQGELASSLETFAGAVTPTESTYRFDAYGQLTERTTTYSSYTRVSRYTWQNGNVVALVELDGNGQKRSEWSFTYDQQPNYKELLSISTSPDQPRNYNNLVKSQLDQDYTGLIDLCINPYGTSYTYRPDGLVSRWDVSSCSPYYNEIEYEPKQ